MLNGSCPTLPKSLLLSPTPSNLSFGPLCSIPPSKAPSFSSPLFQYILTLNPELLSSWLLMHLTLMWVPSYSSGSVVPGLL